MSAYEKGISLIELCMALIILGLLTAPLALRAKIHFYEKKLSDTSVALNAASKAIEDYYFAHDRYPCPSDLTLSPNDPNYGTAVCAAGPNPVMEGGIPFKDLQIPATYALDGWSNRITYHVTRAQTTSSPLTTPGVITVRGYYDPSLGMTADEPGADPYNLTREVENMDPEGEHHYVLVSHGMDGTGTYSAQGVQVAPCPTGGTLPLDAENCNGDAIFFNSFAARAEIGVERYDDITTVQSRPSSRIWAYASNGVDIVSNAGWIGIGKNNPATDLDVEGNILVNNDSHGNWMCDENGLNCFQASSIVDNEIDCGADKAMRGIAFGQEVCTNSEVSTSLSGTCPAGKFVIGIDAAGNVICQP